MTPIVFALMIMAAWGWRIAYLLRPDVIPYAVPWGLSIPGMLAILVAVIFDGVRLYPLIRRAYSKR
jgi:hypothetical protein